MRVIALLLALSLFSACLVEGRCVVEVAELAAPTGKAASVELKVSDATSASVHPKSATGALDALTNLGGAAIKAALALLL